MVRQSGVLPLSLPLVSDDVDLLISHPEEGKETGLVISGFVLVILFLSPSHVSGARIVAMMWTFSSLTQRRERRLVASL